VFDAMVKALPEQLFAAPAGTSGNLSIGGYDPLRQCSYVMYVISGGGYGGSAHGDGLSNGCSTIGISKTTPIEVMEQYYPMLFEEYSLHEASGGAGEHRGGFGVNYKIRLRRGEARASMVMDHGRLGPNGARGGAHGGVNRVRVRREREAYIPAHLSKDQGIALAAGDLIEVSTPRGGGYGEPFKRSAAMVARDVGRGYYSAAAAQAAFGVVLDANGTLDVAATDALRRGRAGARGAPSACRIARRTKLPAPMYV
jgi:N-methylhydantoinase B